MRRAIPRHEPAPDPWPAPVGSQAWRSAALPRPTVIRPASPEPGYVHPPVPGDPLLQRRPVLPPAAGPRLHRRRRLLVRLVVAFLALQLVVATFIGSLRWWAPPRTAFMLESGEPVVYQYASLDHVSRYLIAAVIAHEDQQLGTRSGAFSMSQLRSRTWAYVTGQPDPAGSTIPQQLAKNIFLWPHQDPARKAIEAALASEMSWSLPPQRLMELYVNYAQFGAGLYGICAASWYYFGEPPWSMTQYQADQLMGVLPDPDRVRRAAGGGLDLGPQADPQAVDLINGAANVHVPTELEGMGGWQAAVATIGIHDTAATHAAGASSADACSTMPQSVAQRLDQS